MQVYTMTRKNSKNCKKYLHSTISYKYKIVLWKFFYAGSQIRAVQIRAMRNRASWGMTVLQKSPNKWVKFFPTQTLLMHAPKFQIGICMYKCYIKITAGGQWRKENGVTEEEEDWDCNVPWKLSRIYHILNRDHFAESSRTHFSSWRWWWIRYTFFVKSQCT